MEEDSPWNSVPDLLDESIDENVNEESSSMRAGSDKPNNDNSKPAETRNIDTGSNEDAVMLDLLELPEEQNPWDILDLPTTEENILNPTNKESSVSQDSEMNINDNTKSSTDVNSPSRNEVDPVVREIQQKELSTPHSSPVKNANAPKSTPPRHPNAKRVLIDLSEEDEEDDGSDADDDHVIDSIPSSEPSTEEDEALVDFSDLSKDENEDSEAKMNYEENIVNYDHPLAQINEPASALSSSHSDNDESGLGPMMRLVIKTTKEEEEADRIEQEAERQHWKEVRSRAPKRIVAPNHSLKKFQQQQREREVMSLKLEKTSSSLLTRAKTETTDGAETAKVSGVAKSLFFASSKGADHIVHDTVLKSPNRRGADVKSYIKTIRPEDEANLIVTPRIIRQRKKIFQLFVLGSVGLALSFGLNVYSQAACYFANVDIMQLDGVPVRFHFGMWQYTPMESVYNNYDGCTRYGDEFEDYAPIFARTIALLGLLAALVALAILWFFLVMRQIGTFIWKTACFMMFLACLLQALSIFLFFTGEICEEDGFECSMGPIGRFCLGFGSVSNIDFQIFHIRALTYKYFRWNKCLHHLSSLICGNWNGNE